MPQINNRSQTDHLPTVIVGFGDALSCPEVVWSLTDHGFEVIIFFREGSIPASYYCKGVRLHAIPKPEHSINRCKMALIELVKRNPAAVVMPLDDASVFLFDSLHQQLPTTCKYAGPIGSQADIALDKRLQIQYAQKAGFKVPPTDCQQGLTSLSHVEHPIIIKPALAAEKNGDIMTRGKFHRIANNNELHRLKEQFLCEEKPLLIQQIVQGVGEGIFGIRIGTTVHCWSAHRRLRMMNPAGSGSSACELKIPDNSIMKIVENFLTLIDWQGLFMVELLRDEKNTPWFMELNGRSWGSMALARRQQLEYPVWAACAAMDKNFIPSQPALLPKKIVCRHLGRELVHILFVFRGANSMMPWPGKMETIKNVLSWHSAGRWYNWRWGQTKVFWLDTFNVIFQRIFSNRIKSGLAIKRTFIQRIKGRLKKPFIKRQQQRLKQIGHFRKKALDAQNILFVCYGNINRSPVAQQCMEALDKKRNVLSCGFHSVTQRPADGNMKNVAQKNNINLEHWESSCIDGAMVEQADVILAMETMHLIWLHERYPQALDKSALFGTLSQEGPLEIQDPYQRSIAEYEKCFRDIQLMCKEMHCHNADANFSKH